MKIVFATLLLMALGTAAPAQSITGHGSGGGTGSHADCGKGAWTTPAVETCYRTTPRYDETMAYVRRIARPPPAR